MSNKFRPQRAERLGVGLLDEKYLYHKSLWYWYVDNNGYLVVEKRSKT